MALNESPLHDEAGWPSDEEWQEMLVRLQHFYGKYQEPDMEAQD